MPTVRDDPSKTRPRLVRAPRKLVAGLALLLLSAFALWAVRDLSQGTPQFMGPAMFPRWVAILIGLCGLTLILASAGRNGEEIGRLPLRGPVLVSAGILLFALTIRELGLAVAGPLAVIVSGFAADDVRPSEIVLFAIALTVFCIALFRYLLDLAMPILVIPGTSVSL
jgi:putative tricarboxylic transport membrane protein